MVTPTKQARHHLYSLHVSDLALTDTGVMSFNHASSSNEVGKDPKSIRVFEKVLLEIGYWSTFRASAPPFILRQRPPRRPPKSLQGSTEGLRAARCKSNTRA
jgi:hypothetical protein